MANKVSYLIQLQDRFSREARAIRRQMSGIDKNAGKAARTINQRLAGSFKDLGKTAKNALASVVAAFGIREFITRGAAFQDAIADLSSITGEAGEQLQFLSDESLRLAKSAAIAQVDVANAFTAIASAKSELLKDPKGLSIVTEQALLLANAAGISVPDAVRASVGALNQFGAGADQAARFVNVLAAGSKVGASQVAETAEAMKNAGTVAAQFGLTFEQTNAIIQVFAKSELKGAEAGTALRGTLSKLEKIAGGQLAPSKLGIIKSLEIIERLSLSNTQIIKEFGEENLRAILILRQNVPLIKQWTKELTGTNIASEQAEKRLSTFNTKLRRLGISLNDKVIKTFLRLEPVLNKQVSRLGAFFDTIDAKQIDGMGDSLAAVVEILGILGTAIKIPLALLKGLGTSIGELAASIVTGTLFDFDIGTSIAESFSIGGKFLGVFEQEKPIVQVELAPIKTPEIVATVVPIKVPGLMVKVAPVKLPEIVATVTPIKPPEAMITVAPITAPEIVAKVAPIKLPEVVAKVAPVKLPEIVANVAPLKVPEAMIKVAPIKVPEAMIKVAPIKPPEAMIKIAPIKAPEALIKMETAKPASAIGFDAVKTQTDVNINIRAPAGTVESIKTKTTGGRAGLNMGVNMQVAG